MAFDALSGFKIVVSQYNLTYIVGDYFAVFDDETDVPEVYEWKAVQIYEEQPDHFRIAFERAEYTIPKNCFVDNMQLIHFRTVAEGMLAGRKDVTFNIKNRIIPPKYNYSNADMSNNAFTATGIYVEKEINAGSVSHIYSKIKVPIWLIAVLSAGLSFASLWIFGKDIEKIFIFYIVIAFFIGIGVGTTIYLILCIIARYRYAGFLKKDVSTVENIVFVVAPDGFGAIEQCIYCGKELIPWSFAKYFYETKFSF